MMRWNSFVGSALFAAIAAAAYLPWMILVGPIVGGWNAQALYLLLTTAAYVAGLAAPRWRALPAVAFVVVVGGAALVVAPNTTELVLCLAALLGIARSGFLYHAAPPRAALLELGLLGGGLLLARFLRGTGYPTAVLPVWGFFLAQSCFFLVGGMRARAAAADVDAFEAAHRRAVSLLDRAGV